MHIPGPGPWHRRLPLPARGLLAYMQLRASFNPQQLRDCCSSMTRPMQVRMHMHQALGLGAVTPPQPQRRGFLCVAAAVNSARGPAPPHYAHTGLRAWAAQTAQPRACARRTGPARTSAYPGGIGMRRDRRRDFCTGTRASDAGATCQTAAWPVAGRCLRSIQVCTWPDGKWC